VRSTNGVKERNGTCPKKTKERSSDTNNLNMLQQTGHALKPHQLTSIE
jgi:hypothetical protein